MIIHNKQRTFTAVRVLQVAPDQEQELPEIFFVGAPRWHEQGPFETGSDRTEQSLRESRLVENDFDGLKKTIRTSVIIPISKEEKKQHEIAANVLYRSTLRHKSSC